MAEYQVRIYSNTGLNTNNILDNPSRLSSLPATDILDVDPVYILTNQGLTELIVAASKRQLAQADYLRIGNNEEGFEYYDITRVANPITESTTRLIINSDPLASVGGISRAGTAAVTANFQITDGVTSRLTEAFDIWGAYTEDDPLCTPQEPLVLATEWITVPKKERPLNEDHTYEVDTGMGNGALSAYYKDPVFLESTLDIPKQYIRRAGKTYTDPETEKDTTCPEVYPIGTADDANLGTYNQVTNFQFETDSDEEINDGTAVFCPNDIRKATLTNTSGTVTSTGSEAGAVIKAGLAQVQALGVAQGAVLAQWRVPSGYIDNISSTVFFIGDAKDGTNNNTGQNITRIVATTGTLTPTDTKITNPYSGNSFIHNKRLTYGKYNKYGMMTCAGNSVEFNPEELLESEDEELTITYKADPRHDGKPYYRFTKILGNDDFWRNCIAGSNWQNVPLVYQGASGSALTRLNYDNSRAISSLEKEQYTQNYAVSQISAGANLALSAATFGQTSSMLASGGMSRSVTSQVQGLNAQATGGIVGSVENLVTNELARQQYNQTYAQEKANELSSLYQATTVYAPTVTFPYNADILRDIKGNGILVYRYYLSYSDTLRIDQLLTMYGYKVTEPVSLQMFYTHTKFDYIAVNNLQVTGLPKWRAQDLAAQLNGGVRIWHCLPSQNMSSYIDGSNTPIEEIPSTE